MDTQSFANDFIAKARRHRDALPIQNYSVRYRLNRILMNMLDELDKRDDVLDIIKIIFSDKTSNADIWIVNYFRSRGKFVDVIDSHMEERIL